MAEDENKTDGESDVLLQGAESVVSGKGSDDAPFESLSLDSDLLRNIPVTISVEVGRTSLPIKALMQLTQGSVVELDRLAGEALDLLVNNTLVAQGEIVLVNERYGIRLTQIVPKSARLKLGQEAT
ncbi:MAG: flagellar motor switch protein FliN [Gammaproteobacteria bacterium]|nr:flagellar motor switch protein FliN [Gammaproteobacteria bacterium]